MFREGFDDGARFVGAAAGATVAVLCNLLSLSLNQLAVNESSIGKVAQLEAHLDAQQVEKIVLRQNVAGAGESAFGEDIGGAELVAVNVEPGGMVAVENHFAPVVAMAVDRAAIVENDTFNFFHHSSHR